MSDDRGDDRPVGDPTPEATRQRLRRLYGEDIAPTGDSAAATETGAAGDATADAGNRPGRYYVAAPAAPAARQKAGRAAYETAARMSPDADGPSTRSAASSSARSTPRTTSRHRLRWIPRPRAKWFRPKLRWLLLYLPLLLVLLVIAAVLFAWSEFSDLERLDLGNALAPTSSGAVNYLIVGSDSREGVDADTANVGAIGLHVSGHRSDTIIVMHIADGAATMMSIPRDLWVTNAATGRKGRINGTYNDSRANLVKSVTLNLGIPINHYVEVDFVTFSEMVDAMGGVDIKFPHPAFDTHSGLKVDRAGVVRLDGTQSLAYVRSRHYTEVVDGKLRTDPLADIGRQKRQQEFIRAVLAEVGATRNPWTLGKIAVACAHGMRVDNQLGFGDALSLVRGLGGSHLESVVLPTHGTRKGSAAVLELNDANAMQHAALEAVLAKVGGGTH